MKFFAAAAAATLTFTLASLLSEVRGDGHCPEVWECPLIDVAPTLDADHSEWDNVPNFTTSLVGIAGNEYVGGHAVMKCAHDAEQIYFALEIPGEYRFNTTDNKKCASIGTMTKVGVDATYRDMGGCPDAFAGCGDDGLPPPTCDAHLVDLGAHWELKTTEQGVEYGMNDTTGSGNDLVANNDDEYAVNSFCRLDDNDADAANEWAGAWLHTNPVEGEVGTYKFELSRLLTTASTVSDAQYVTGEAFEFGVAFWDPFEAEETGWTDAGHFITGCGSKWVTLKLGEVADEIVGDDQVVTEPSTGSGSANNLAGIVAICVMVGLQFRN